MKYTKSIKVTDTGMVLASVYCGDRRVGWKSFDSPFYRSTKQVERACIRAHAWADEYMSVCERQETD